MRSARCTDRIDSLRHSHAVSALNHADLKTTLRKGGVTEYSIAISGVLAEEAFPTKNQIPLESRCALLGESELNRTFAFLPNACGASSNGGPLP